MYRAPARLCEGRPVWRIRVRLPHRTRGPAGGGEYAHRDRLVRLGLQAESGKLLQQQAGREHRRIRAGEQGVGRGGGEGGGVDGKEKEGWREGEAGEGPQKFREFRFAQGPSLAGRGGRGARDGYTE